MTDAELLDFSVRRTDLSEVRWAEAQTRPDQELASGDVLLRVDRFGLTANNVTYGLAGDLMGYWNFFPAPAGWGRLPVWGFATVVKSRAPTVAEGERVFGYLPISPYLHVQASSESDGAFTDTSEHRRALPAVYQRYARAAPSEPVKEDLRALLSPLFGTGFLLDDWIVEQGLFGARQVLFASASSRTALGCAFMLSRRAQRDFEVVGLTSARNRAFCERVGYYDRVVEYDAIRTLPAATPTLLVDMAGDPAVTSAVHTHFGSALRHDCVVGLTHRPASLAPPADLPGPAPQMFFAPTQGEARRTQWGAEEFAKRVGQAQDAFYASAMTWLEFKHGRGRAAIESAYRQVLDGQVPPNQGVILSPG